MPMTTTPPKFVRWALMLGIVIALNIFFFVGRSLILPEPKFEDYCPSMQQPVVEKSQCEKNNGVWIQQAPIDEKTAPVVSKNPPGTCDFYQKCQPLYDAARKQFQMYAFVVMVGLGILALVVGVLPLGSSIVSTGLSYGGVVALIVGAIGYWGEAANLLKFAMSSIALAALIYIGLRRFKD